MLPSTIIADEATLSVRAMESSEPMQTIKPASRTPFSQRKHTMKYDLTIFTTNGMSERSPSFPCYQRCRYVRTFSERKGFSITDLDCHFRIASQSSQAVLSAFSFSVFLRFFDSSPCPFHTAFSVARTSCASKSRCALLPPIFAQSARTDKSL